MSRLIDADVLKRKAQKEATEAWKMNITARVETILNQFIDWIEEAPTVEPEPHWIPCSERLPEEGERVLCTHLGGLDPNRQVIEHIYEGGQFVLGWEMDMNPSSPTFMQRYMGKVVAWMPMPEPYKENK